jgi:phosphoenolpyruvate carboxykinase (ATP)
LRAGLPASWRVGDKTARALVGMFRKNFARFENDVDAEVKAAAPEARIAAE